LPVLAGVTTERSQLYAGPGIFYPLVGELVAGTSVRVFTRDHDFYAIEYLDQIAYADIDHIDVTASGSPQLNVATTSEAPTATDTAAPPATTTTSEQAPQTASMPPEPPVTQPADELNRTPPRTQSAFLEAMDEGAVTVDGMRHALPDPFFVVATQNPLEQHGTYPLPEGQLDRFAVCLRLGGLDLAFELGFDLPDGLPDVLCGGFASFGEVDAFGAMILRVIPASEIPELLELAEQEFIAPRRVRSRDAPPRAHSRAARHGSQIAARAVPPPRSRLSGHDGGQPYADHLQPA